MTGQNCDMRKAVDSRDNGHTAKTYSNPLGIECETCKRRALVPLDRLGQLDGNRRPRWQWRASSIVTAKRCAAAARWSCGARS